MKNFFKNFRYMSYDELRIFWVIIAGILLIIAILTANIFSQNVKDNTQKIATVNKETSKLLKNTTKPKDEQHLLDDSKTKNVYKSKSPQQDIKTALSAILDFPDGTTLKNHYEASKGEIKGSVWTIPAGGTESEPGFMTNAWQQKSGTNHYAGSLSDLTIVPVSENKYNVTVSFSPSGTDISNSDTVTYWLDVSINGNVKTINILKQLDSNY